MLYALNYGLCPYDGTHAIKHAIFENFSVAHDVILCFVGYICIFSISSLAFYDLRF